MPIYSYRCEDCEHAQDVLQKISDPPPVVCPSCGASAFRKQVTAAGFQLKGSGWYVTDFRNPPAGKVGAKAKGEGGAADAASGDTGPNVSASSDEKGKPGVDSNANGKPSAPAPSAGPSSAGDKGSASPPPSSAPSTAASA